MGIFLKKRISIFFILFEKLRQRIEKTHRQSQEGKSHQINFGIQVKPSLLRGLAWWHRVLIGITMGLIGIYGRRLRIVIIGREKSGIGVETAEPFSFLAAHGCDEYQGHFLSRPLQGNDFA